MALSGWTNGDILCVSGKCRRPLRISACGLCLEAARALDVIAANFRVAFSSVQTASGAVAWASSVCCRHSFEPNR